MKLLFIILFLSGLTVFGQTSKNDSCYAVLDTLTNQRVFKSADKMPTVDGGYEILYKEISKKLKYPHVDQYPIDNKVIVAFIITEDGQVTGKRILKNAYGVGDKLLDIVDDAIWNPGSCNGKKVPIFLILPMYIDID